MISGLSSAALPVLRRLDPERAHRLAILALRLGLIRGKPDPDDPALAVGAFGLRFANPIGLAAGFDKNAQAIRGLRRLGFGLLEFGTVTLLPQPGNPRPRAFRLEEDQAIINRYGFNSHGVDAVLARLSRAPRHGPPVSINVGPNKGADPLRDLPGLVAALAPYADAITVNLSSPNTPGLRNWQAGDRVRALLDAIRTATPACPPLLLKIAPDQPEGALADIIDACVAGGAAGLIVGNTTVARPATLRSAARSEAGGLSGAPLFEPSTALLRQAYRLAQGRLVLIGCGGIATGEQALAKIMAGASLLQLYTAFAYAGPALVPRIKRDLLAALHARGYATLTEAVGRSA